MPEELYSTNESLDRIYRLLKGESVSEPPNALTPPLSSENEALSGIAELLAGTLEGYQARPPAGFGGYGMIYNTTAALTQTLVSGAYTKINQFNTVGGVYAGVTPSHSNDLITINKAGYYSVGYDLDFAGTTGTLYEFSIWKNGSTALADTYALVHYVNPTGTYISVSSEGMALLAVGDYVAVYGNVSDNGIRCDLRAGRLWVKPI